MGALASPVADILQEFHAVDLRHVVIGEDDVGTGGGGGTGTGGGAEQGAFLWIRVGENRVTSALDQDMQ